MKQPYLNERERKFIINHSKHWYTKDLLRRFILAKSLRDLKRELIIILYLDEILNFIIKPSKTRSFLIIMFLGVIIAHLIWLIGYLVNWYKFNIEVYGL